MPVAPDDEPQRRRGANLETAIYAAVFDELADSSFEQLTFERIAARAGAGKASVYRRWSDTTELTLAALASFDLPVLAHPGPSTGVLRDDLVAVLVDLGEGLDTPHGRALRGLMAQRERHPSLYASVVELMVLPRQRRIAEVLTAAVERGDVDPAAITSLIVRVGPQLMVVHFAEFGTYSVEHIESVVDQLILPALSRPLRATTGTPPSQKEEIR